MTIELENICKSYDGKNVLNNFSLNIENEQFIVICGEDGCGKTTLVRILLGLEKYDSGKITLLGDYKYPYLNASAVFDTPRLCEDFDAITNVCIVDDKTSKIHAREKLLLLLSEDKLETKVSNLSYNDQMKVAIVRAMLHTSDIFILDEPFKNFNQEEKDAAIKFIMSEKGSNPVVITGKSKDEFTFGRIINL